jgi:hypothetical protein
MMLWGGSIPGDMVKLRIQEVRTLLLPVETVVDAILELNRSNGGTLAASRLTEVRVERGENPGLSLVIQQASGGTETTVCRHFSMAAIAAAAIHYCLRARIPLPRQSTKSLEVTAEGFQLTIQKLSEVLRLHGEVPMVCHDEPGAFFEDVELSDDPAPATAAGARGAAA